MRSPFAAVLLAALIAAPAAAQSPAVRLTDLAGPNEAWVPRHLTYLGDRLYFAADGGDGKGVELWMVDLVTGAVDVAADVNPDSSSYPADLTPLGDDLYFTADGATGRELWRYSPATHTATQAAAVHPLPVNPPSLIAFEGRLYFTADAGGGQGSELWTYDPTTGEARMVEDLTARIIGVRPWANSVEPQSQPEAMVVYDGALHFCTRSKGWSGILQLQYVDLWSYSAAEDSIHHVQTIPTGRYAWCERPRVSGDDLYFVMNLTSGAGGASYHLFRYGGPGEPVERLDLLIGWIGMGSTLIYPVASFAGRVFTSAFQLAWGSVTPRLVAYDPGLDSLLTIRDVPVPNPDTTQSVAIEPVYSTLAEYEGALYMNIAASEGNELWRYTADGQFVLAADVNPTGDSTPSELTPTPYGLAFFANGGDGTGRELWLFKAEPVATEPDAAPTALTLSPPVPNPSRNGAALTLSVDRPQTVRVAVYDVTGRRVLVLHDGPAATSLRLSVPAGSLPSGTYVVRAEGESAVAMQRLVVVR